MKILLATSTGTTDSVYHTLINRISVNIDLVLVSWDENFVFNDALLDVKDYVLICFCEYGYDWRPHETGTHIWGSNSEKFPRYYNKDWVIFDKWVKENPPKIIFKRELLKKDVSDKIKPIEYPCLVEIPQVDTKEQYYVRPINVFHYWGRSSEDRVKAHGNFWIKSSENGAAICDSLYHLDLFLREEKNSNKWVGINIPHYARVDISNIMAINGVSKLSLSMSGAGKKCFRHGESPSSSVMVMEENDIAWTFPWLDGVNCLQYGKESWKDPVERINDALTFYTYETLYTIYLAGIENCRKYYIPNYIKHLEKTINEAIR